ncbi:MAG: urea ABC transporter substrate-binding protein [Cellvibrionaceae bacterium]
MKNFNNIGATLLSGFKAHLSTISKVAVFGVAIPFSLAVHADSDIKVGAIFDLTGGLNIYGIQQSRAMHLAIDELNANGGVLGKQAEIVEYDSQSELSKYTVYTKTLTLKDKADVLFAGLTSSSREAIRPLVRKAKIPYFYSSLYEGGACDKYTFVTGASASQQMSVLIEWAIKNHGKRIFVMAPKYNFGTISAHWVKLYAEQFGGEVVTSEFIPLTVTDYSSTIQKIQAVKPDFVVALPVGANQTGFLEQYAAAGMKEKAPIVSTNYGSGNQQVVVSKDTGEGIIASQQYFMWIDEPKNKEFVAKWKAKYGLDEPIVSGAVDVWNAVNLWAKAVEKAGTTDSDKVIAALESGLSFDAPNGLVKMLPGSHHLSQNIYIVKGDRNHGFETIETYPDVAPAYENEVCDLVQKPKTKKHFVPI